MSGRYKLYFGGFVLTTVLVIGAALLGLWDALSVLTGTVTYSEDFILLAMLGAAAEWVVAVIAFGLLAIVFLLATVVSILRTKSMPKSSRLAGYVERLEHKFPVLRRYDVKDKVEPSTEKRADKLKQQYVDGEISDAEFEREMDKLLDEEDSSRAQSRSRSKNINIED